MSEIIKERVKKSIGCEAKIFLNNGFKYEGKISNADDDYLELIDFKIDGFKLIKWKDISDVTILNKEGGKE